MSFKFKISRFIYWANNRRDVIPEFYPGDREVPTSVNFSKTVTLPRVPPDQLSWTQDRCCPLRYIRVRCTEDSSPDLLRRRFFLDEERRWMRSGQSWTSFDSHARREKSIFFISENAFSVTKGALLHTLNCRGGRLH